MAIAPGNSSSSSGPFWEDGVLALYHLRANGYERVDGSELPALQALNIELLTRCILLGETSRLNAIKIFFRAGF